MHTLTRLIAYNGSYNEYHIETLTLTGICSAIVDGVDSDFYPMLSYTTIKATISEKVLTTVYTNNGLRAIRLVGKGFNGEKYIEVIA